MKTLIQEDKRTPLYIAALFTIAKIWKGFPSGSLVKNLQCVCIIKYSNVHNTTKYDLLFILYVFCESSFFPLFVHLLNCSPKEFGFPSVSCFLEAEKRRPKRGGNAERGGIEKCHQRSQRKLTGIDQEVTPKLASGTEEEASFPQVSVDAVAKLVGRAASVGPVFGLHTPVQGPSLDGPRPSSGQLDEQSRLR